MWIAHQIANYLITQAVPYMNAAAKEIFLAITHTGSYCNFLFILCSYEIMILWPHHASVSMCLPNNIRALSTKYDKALEVQKIQIP